MTREEWIKLAERCESATGPDRVIDAAIYHAVCRGMFGHSENERNAPTYSRSLDAITALIEREFPKMSRCIKWYPGKFAVAYLWEGDETSASIQGICTSEARALCAAFCRAKAEVA